MPAHLPATIQKLSEIFADNVLQAIRGMSLEEIASLGVGRRGPGRPPKNPLALGAAATKGGGKRLASRSMADLEKMVDKIVALVKANKKGINAERIRAGLKVPRKELPRPMAMALASKKIRKKGQKRATIYFAA